MSEETPDSEEVQSALEYLEMLKEGNMFVGKGGYAGATHQIGKTGCPSFGGISVNEKACPRGEDAASPVQFRHGGHC